jgi:hypothetical protein
MEAARSEFDDGQIITHAKKLRLLIEKMTPKDKQIALEGLAYELKRHYSKVVDERDYYPGGISDMERMVEIVEKSGICMLGEQTPIKLKKEVLWGRVQLHAHGAAYREKIGHESVKATVREFRELLSNNAVSLYGNMFQELIDRIEYDLILVQNECFNWFNFEDVIDYLDDDYALISDCVKVISRNDEKNLKDDFLARINGTIGQAYAFMSDKPGLDNSERNRLLKDSEDFLMQDLFLLREENSLYQQGLNYLVSLYWISEKIDRAAAVMIGGICSDLVVNEDDLKSFDVGSPSKKNDSKRSYFILLNQLRILASLARERGWYCKVDQLCGLYNEIEARHEYPYNLVKKWISFLLAERKEYAIPIKMLSELIEEERTSPILELMRAVEASLLVKIASDAGDAVAGNIALDYMKKAIKNIDGNESIMTFIKASPWYEKASRGNMDGIGYWDIVCALPYYYK